jgi:dihydrofolate synthase/folylpolyglutamate synthase
MDAGELQQEALKYGLRGELYPGVKEALSEAGKSSRPDDLIYVGGSTFVVAELPI